MANTTKEPTVQEKVYNLFVEFLEAKGHLKERKDAVKAANEEVKRIQAELEELLEAAGDAPAND